MSRVKYLEGKEPFLIVAPHGAYTNDTNTDIIAYEMAKELNGYAVINVGWKRGIVDHENNRANLNNLAHCMREDVVQEEFLDPLVHFKHQIVNKYDLCYMYLIHGMSANVLRRVKDNVDIVLGYGQGKKARHSCDLEHKDQYINALRLAGLNVYQGKSGGRFSAWSKWNVNQLFNLWDGDSRVQSLQLELVPSMRKLPAMAKNSGLVLAKAAERASWRLDKLPSDFSVMEC